MYHLQKIIFGKFSKQTPSHIPSTATDALLHGPSSTRSETSIDFLPQAAGEAAARTAWLWGVRAVPVRGALAGGVVLEEEALQGTGHARLLEGERWLQPQAAGVAAPSAPAGCIQQRLGLRWLGSGRCIWVCTKTWPLCWCRGEAGRAGRSWAAVLGRAGGRSRRAGALQDMETEHKADEEQKSTFFALFVSNPTWC